MPRYSLDSVTIDGFRGLRNLRLDNLGLINILVGPNNCGKTSVLEALSTMKIRISTSNPVAAQRSRTSCNQPDRSSVQI
jgi:AAA15 family ATPase/GTPase